MRSGPDSPGIDPAILSGRFYPWSFRGWGTCWVPPHAVDLLLLLAHISGHEIIIKSSSKVTNYVISTLYVISYDMRTSSTFSALIQGTLSNSPLVVVIALGLAISYVLYATITAVYRLYFHPLVNFPGPHEACRSKKWLLAQSKTGRAEEVFEKLHQNYG
jgi:hypothetical protein